MKDYQFTENQVRLFWMKVDKTDTCWLWLRSKSKRGGYGQVWIENKGSKKVVYMAHRVAYSLENGPIPDGGEIDHACHNRLCVNPAHLRFVTRKQNNENRRGPNKNSTSGVRGVHWNKQTGKWHALVTHNHKLHFGGSFSSVEDASDAVTALRNKLFTHNTLDRLEGQEAQHPINKEMSKP